MDIVNPVQVSAEGMDSKRLKAAYGKDITFWGGGVDTQHVLPFGTPEEVRDEVKRRIDDFAPGGGFVFATVHNIQAFVPPANIEAAYDTVLTSTAAPAHEHGAADPSPAVAAAPTAHPGPHLRGPGAQRLPLRGALAARRGRPPQPAWPARRPAQPAHHPAVPDRRDRRAL